MFASGFRRRRMLEQNDFLGKNNNNRRLATDTEADDYTIWLVETINKDELFDPA